MVMVMSANKHKEKISAFLDNELHRDEVMSFSLSSEPEDANIIRRYQIAGDVLRGELSEESFIDVSKAVHIALQGESHAVASNASAVNAAASKKSERFSLSAWFRPVAGMAVAASAAMAMVITLSGEDDPSGTPVAANIQQQPAMFNTSPYLRVASDDKLADKKVQNLDPRLVNRHLEFATQDALQGRLPYVRAVSYERTQ